MGERYNGHANYETWVVSLWIDNDQYDSERWAEHAEQAYEDATDDGVFSRSENAASELADAIEAEYQELLEEKSKGLPGVFADMLNASVGEVDWHEIATGMIEEVDKADIDAESLDS